MTIENRYQIAQLATEYGALLTTKQQEILSMYCDMDLSLAEVATEYGISRQAVRDTLLRAVEALEGYERVLHAVAVKESLSHCLSQCTEENWQEQIAKARAILED